MLRIHIQLFVVVIVFTQCCLSVAQGQDVYPPMIKLGEFEGHAGVSWIPRFLGEQDAVIMSFNRGERPRFVRINALDSIDRVASDPNDVFIMPFHRGDVNGDGVDDYAGWAYTCIVSQPDGSFRRVHQEGSSSYFQDFDLDGMVDGAMYYSQKQTFFSWGDREQPLSQRSYVRYPELRLQPGWQFPEDGIRQGIALFRVGGTTWLVEKYSEQAAGFPEISQAKIAFHRINPDDLARHADTITCLEGSIVWDAMPEEIVQPYVYSFETSFTILDHGKLLHIVTEDTVTWRRQTPRFCVDDEHSPARIGYSSTGYFRHSVVFQRVERFDFGLSHACNAVILYGYSEADSSFQQNAAVSIPSFGDSLARLDGASPFPDITGDGKPELAIVVRRKDVPTVMIYDPYGTLTHTSGDARDVLQPAPPYASRETLRWTAPGEGIVNVTIVDLSGRILQERKTDAATLQTGISMTLPSGPLGVRFTCCGTTYSYVVGIQ